MARSDKTRPRIEKEHVMEENLDQVERMNSSDQENVIDSGSDSNIEDEIKKNRT